MCSAVCSVGERGRGKRRERGKKRRERRRGEEEEGEEGEEEEEGHFHLVPQAAVNDVSVSRIVGTVNNVIFSRHEMQS